MRGYYARCPQCGLCRPLSNIWLMARLKWWYYGLAYDLWSVSCPFGAPSKMEFRRVQ